MSEELRIPEIYLMQRDGTTIPLHLFFQKYVMKAIKYLDPFLGKEITDIGQVKFDNLQGEIHKHLIICYTWPGCEPGVVYNFNQVMRYEILISGIEDRVRRDISSRLELLKRKKEDMIPRWFGNNRLASDIQKDLDNIKSGPVIPFSGNLSIPNHSVSHKLINQFFVDESGKVECELIRVPIIEGVAYVKKIRLRDGLSSIFRCMFTGKMVYIGGPAGKRENEDGIFYRYEALSNEEIRDKVMLRFARKGSVGVPVKDKVKKSRGSFECPF